MRGVDHDGGGSGVDSLVGAPTARGRQDGTILDRHLYLGASSITFNIQRPRLTEPESACHHHVSLSGPFARTRREAEERARAFPVVYCGAAGPLDEEERGRE